MSDDALRAGKELLAAGRNLDADALPDDLAALRGGYYLNSDRESDAFDAALAEIVKLRAALAEPARAPAPEPGHFKQCVNCGWFWERGFDAGRAAVGGPAEAAAQTERMRSSLQAALNEFPTRCSVKSIAFHERLCAELLRLGVRAADMHEGAPPSGSPAEP
jgi:hypothetical protein